MVSTNRRAGKMRNKENVKTSQQGTASIASSATDPAGHVAASRPEKEIEKSAVADVQTVSTNRRAGKMRNKENVKTSQQGTASIASSATDPAGHGAASRPEKEIEKSAVADVQTVSTNRRAGKMRNGENAKTSQPGTASIAGSATDLAGHGAASRPEKEMEESAVADVQTVSTNRRAGKMQNGENAKTSQPGTASIAGSATDLAGHGAASRPEKEMEESAVADVQTVSTNRRAGKMLNGENAKTSQPGTASIARSATDLAGHGAASRPEKEMEESAVADVQTVSTNRRAGKMQNGENTKTSQPGTASIARSATDLAGPNVESISQIGSMTIPREDAVQGGTAPCSTKAARNRWTRARGSQQDPEVWFSAWLQHVC